MKSPLFLKPVFQERIWGGTTLKDEFGYEIPSDKTGECWAISAHPNGPSEVENGPLAGKTLIDIWNDHRELFGNQEGKVFPLLTKILDAKNDLSVQVHPDDEYADKHENGELGKTECWYIIDCDKDADMIFGHEAQTKEELESMIANGEWNSLLKRVPIQPGDFFYVPSGTVHALCKGTLVLETQQSSDTTYRVYDYDRTDDQGNTRELHLEKAVDVTTVPNTAGKLNDPERIVQGDLTVTKFVEAQYFSVYKWSLNGSHKLQQDQPYQLFSVLEGQGSITTEDGTFDLKKGQQFILPATVREYELNGKLEFIVSHN